MSKNVVIFSLKILTFLFLFISLLVHVLCKMNRISEALDLLKGIVCEAEAEDRPRATTKMWFPVETIMTLTKAVEATPDKVKFNLELRLLLTRLLKK